MIIANYTNDNYTLHSLVLTNKRVYSAILYEDIGVLHHAINFVKLPKTLAPKFPNGYINSSIIFGFIQCHPEFKTVNTRGSLRALSHNIDMVGNRKIIFTNTDGCPYRIDEFETLLTYPNVYFKDIVLDNLSPLYVKHSHRFTNTHIKCYKIYNNDEYLDYDTDSSNDTEYSDNEFLDVEFPDNDYSVSHVSVYPCSRRTNSINFKPLAKCMNLRHIHVSFNTNFSIDGATSEHHDLSPLHQISSIKIHNIARVAYPSIVLPPNCHHVELYNAHRENYGRKINILIKNRGVVHYLKYKGHPDIKPDDYPNLKKLTYI